MVVRHRGESVTVPTLAEILRIAAILILWQFREALDLIQDQRPAIEALEEVIRGRCG